MEEYEARYVRIAKHRDPSLPKTISIPELNDGKLVLQEEDQTALKKVAYSFYRAEEKLKAPRCIDRFIDRFLKKEALELEEINSTSIESQRDLLFKHRFENGKLILTLPLAHKLLKKNIALPVEPTATVEPTEKGPGFVCR